MRVNDIMTRTPATVEPGTSIEEVAKQMLVHDCGSLPVVENMRAVGIITDRDIVIRAVAAGRCPLEMTAGDLMSHPVATVHLDDPLENVLKTMETNQVRRAPVIDHVGQVIGIIAQADVARSSRVEDAGELVREISQGIELGHE